MKAIVLLSYFSSGSTALQRLLSQVEGVNHVANTRHMESETLFWTKAASVLGKPQVDLANSEVPMPRDKARKDLVSFLKDNIPEYTVPESDDDLIFDGWYQLCKRHAPIFLEKSPHHLMQWPALELLLSTMERWDDVELQLVGLVRHPMAALYSSYKRWGANPDRCQHEWIVAHENLLKLKDMLGDKLVLVRYEDMVQDPTVLQPIFDFCDGELGSVEAGLHNRSLNRWSTDKSFGFKPCVELVDLAGGFNYPATGMDSPPTIFWPMKRSLGSVQTRLKNVARTLLKR